MLTKTLSEAKKKQRNILIKAMNNDIGSVDSAKDSWNPAQISERAKDISYIRSLVDSWNPAQLNEALKMLDLPVIDTWNPAQIEEQRRNLVFYLAERTLTGNPITLKILGNLTPEVTGLKVTMNPIQSGTGDPSPTNIRPISGRTEASVTRTAGEDAETKTHQYSETIYGGTDDFVNGGATSTMGIVDLGTLNWISEDYEVLGCARVNSVQILPLGIKWSSIPMCSSYKGVLHKAYNAFNYGEIGLSNAESSPQLRCRSEAFIGKTNDEIIAMMSGVQLCYELATPTTIETTPEEITLLKGTNVLSTDGDSIELKYKQNF